VGAPRTVERGRRRRDHFTMGLLYRSMVVAVVAAAAACAPGFTRVSEKQWQTVPPAERDAIDRTTGAELARARAELAAATKALAAAEAAAKAPVAPIAAGAAPGTVADDEAVGKHEQFKRAAIARVVTAKAAWLQASLAWRKQRLEAATAWLALVTAERELIRASAVDRRSSSLDFDLANYRGQLGNAQARYYLATTRTDEARIALHHAGTDLAAAKESVAMLVRDRLPPVEGARPPLKLHATWNSHDRVVPRGMLVRTRQTRNCFTKARWCGLHRTAFGSRFTMGEMSLLVAPKRKRW
jgi:hypothetical protein